MEPVSVLHTCTSQMRLSCLTSKLPSSVPHSIETSSRQSINERSQRIVVMTSSGSNDVFIFDAIRPAMLACDGPMLISCACTVPATKATNRTTTAFLIVLLQCPRYVWSLHPAIDRACGSATDLTGAKDSERERVVGIAMRVGVI